MPRCLPHFCRATRKRGLCWYSSKHGYAFSRSNQQLRNCLHWAAARGRLVREGLRLWSHQSLSRRCCHLHHDMVAKHRGHNGMEGLARFQAEWCPWPCLSCRASGSRSFSTFSHLLCAKVCHVFFCFQPLGPEMRPEKLLNAHHEAIKKRPSDFHSVAFTCGFKWL